MSKGHWVSTTQLPAALEYYMCVCVLGALQWRVSRSLYAFGARLIPPDEGNRGDIRSGCGFTFEVGVVFFKMAVVLR